MKIDHIKGINVCKEYFSHIQSLMENGEIDRKPDHVYHKKWWLEHRFQQMENGELKWFEFRGWINTMALHESDFPETLEGTFWVERNKLQDDGTYGMYGHFDIGFGEKDNYVIGSVYPVHLSENINYAQNPSRENADAILLSLKPVSRFERFDANIQDCLVLENTYVDLVKFGQ